jgi:hypothetical protein
MQYTYGVWSISEVYRCVSSGVAVSSAFHFLTVFWFLSLVSVHKPYELHGLIHDKNHYCHNSHNDLTIGLESSNESPKLLAHSNYGCLMVYWTVALPCPCHDSRLSPLLSVDMNALWNVHAICSLMYPTLGNTTSIWGRALHMLADIPGYYLYRIKQVSIILYLSN